MKLKAASFSGYSSEVYDKIEKWSEGKEGRIVSVQTSERGNAMSDYRTITVWYWDGEPKKTVEATVTIPVAVTVTTPKGVS